MIFITLISYGISYVFLVHMYAGDRALKILFGAGIKKGYADIDRKITDVFRIVQYDPVKSMIALGIIIVMTLGAFYLTDSAILKIMIGGSVAGFIVAAGKALKIRSRHINFIYLGNLVATDRNKNEQT